MATSNSENRKIVGLLLLGGIHHILHLIPIASGLAEFEDIETRIFVRTSEEKRISTDILAALGIENPQIEILKTRRVFNFLSPKLAALLSNLSQFKRVDALVVAEVTSTFLRYVIRNMPLFIRTKHGAGDRAITLNPRNRHFDHMLLPGQKVKERLSETGIISEDRVYVSGYIKPFTLNKINDARPRLFPNRNPVVLYNAHFDPELSSWEPFSETLLEAFAARPDLNFIVAPHIRLFAGRSPQARAAIEHYNQYPNIRVDLGSEKSTDMTYTLAADIYLGDVSSQVYEFLYSGPKPCVFLGRESTAWQDNPDYAHWTYGPVCSSVEGVMDILVGLDKAEGHYEAAQKAGIIFSLGDPNWNPIRRAAVQIRTLLLS